MPRAEIMEKACKRVLILVIMFLTLTAMISHDFDRYIPFLSVISVPLQEYPASLLLPGFPCAHRVFNAVSKSRGLFPWEGYKMTVEVMNWVNPTLADRGIVGSMPTVF